MAKSSQRLRPLYIFSSCNFWRPPPVQSKDALCNPVVMSVVLSVCNRNAWNARAKNLWAAQWWPAAAVQPVATLLTSQAIIISGHADANLSGNRHLGSLCKYITKLCPVEAQAYMPDATFLLRWGDLFERDLDILKMYICTKVKFLGQDILKPECKYWGKNRAPSIVKFEKKHILLFCHARSFKIVSW